MKVLILNQVFYPDSVATAQHATDLALYLKNKGCGVSVLASNRSYNNTKVKYPSESEYQAIRISRLSTLGLGKGRFLYRILDALVFDSLLLLKLLFYPKQDVVLSLTSPPLIGLFGVFFVLLKGGRHISWQMDLNPDTAIAIGYLRESHIVTRLLKGVFRFVLEKSAAIVVLDRWMKKKVELYGIASEKIAVIPPWPVQKMRQSSGERFRKTHGLEGKFIILYSGNHSLVHPLDTLLEAAVLLEKERNILFVFIGAGQRVRQVKEFIEKHQCQNILQLPHQPREMLEESLGMANMHAVVMGQEVTGLVHTSKIYGILETGKPYVAISPKESHLADQIADCPHGFLVEHGDVSGLANAIRQCQKFTSQELKKIETANQHYVNSHYTSEKLLDLFGGVVLGRSETASTVPSLKVAAG